MKPWKWSRLNGGTVLCACLLSAVLSSLTGCATKAVKPSPPPEVRCAQSRTAEIPDWPTDWLQDGPEFALRLLGVITEERRLEAVELDCLDQLRREGVIR